MVDPIRTLVPVINQPFSVSTDQPIQFQESVFGLKQLLVAAGWILKISGNGIAVVADDVGNWATAADVRFGTEGNGSFGIFESPPGWLTNNGTVQLKLYVDENLALNDAQQAPIRLAPNGYTGGSPSVEGTAQIDWDSTGTTVRVADGDNVILDDDVNPPVTLTFDDGTAAVQETITQRRMDISTPPANEEAVRALFNATVNACPLLNIVASDNASAGITDLAQKVRGAGGNTAITDNIVDGLVLVDAAFASGSDGALPSLVAGVETAVLTNGRNMIPWNAPNRGFFSAWRTSRGDIMFGVKREGDPFFLGAWILTSNTDSNGGGSGDQRWAFYGRSAGGTNNALLDTQLRATGNWKGVSPAGDVLETAVQAQCTAWDWGDGWLKGLNNEGETHDVPIEVGNDATTPATSPRFRGTLVDSYGCPSNLPFGWMFADEGDQAQRRVSTGGGLFVFVEFRPYSLQ